MHAVSNQEAAQAIMHCLAKFIVNSIACSARLEGEDNTLHFNAALPETAPDAILPTLGESEELVTDFIKDEHSELLTEVLKAFYERLFVKDYRKEVLVSGNTEHLMLYHPRGVMVIHY